METFPKPKLRGTKKLFIKKGTCSQLLMHILNREFGHLNEAQERAADPLAGGILQQGYQCGMLWGASLAIGAEAYRKCEDLNKATALSIVATKHMMASFSKRTNHTDCYDITDTDFLSKRSMAKYMLTGKFFSCFKLAEKWAPEAIQAAYEGLSQNQDLPNHCISCASELVKKMGGSEEEMIIVAGFAGGLGLSGNGCGALSAAIWMKTLAMCKEQPGKSFYNNPMAKNALEEFYAITDYEILCKDITGENFESLDAHTDFIKNGGCDKVLQVLKKDMK